MTATQMLNHVRVLIEVALEERALRDFSTPLTRTRLFHWLIIEALPWPKGKIRAPITLLDDELLGFDDEKRLLDESLKRFAAAVNSSPARVTRSPMLGLITLEKWSRLHGKHLDHHLRQFGSA